MRASVRDISAAAVEQDFLVKDPARKVTVPSQLCDMDKTILTWEQLRNTLSDLGLRDRILVELDMTNALSPASCSLFVGSLRPGRIENVPTGGLRFTGRNSDAPSG